MNQKSPYPGTQAVLRAMALLAAFTDERPAWNLAELVQMVGLNRTTTYRLITALESAEMVVRDPERDCYRLGPGAIALGGRALRANPLPAVARPELQALAAQTGETATLELLVRDEVQIIEEVLGEHLMSGVQFVGTRWPALLTSTGRAMLAFLPVEDREQALARPVTAVTPATLTDVAALRRELERAQAAGYAVVKDELEVGYVAVGAPVRNFEAEVVGAISLGGPTVRLTDAQLPAIGKLVTAAAARISHGLGY